MRRCGSTLSLLAALAWLGPGLVSSSLEGERRVGRPTLKPGGRVGKFTLVERVQSLPASFSLPPPTVDAPHEVAVLGDGGAAAWLKLSLSDAPNANETTDGLALLEVFRSAPPLSQRSLPAPLPAASFGSGGFDNSAAAQHALPRPFEEELESIAANRRYRLHRRVARGAHGEVWRAVRSDDARQKQLILKRLHAGAALASRCTPCTPLLPLGSWAARPTRPDAPAPEPQHPPHPHPNTPPAPRAQARRACSRACASGTSASGSAARRTSRASRTPSPTLTLNPNPNSNPNRNPKP